MTATDAYAPTACPIPGCGEPLHLTWTMGVPIYRSNLVGDGQALDPEIAYTATWSVDCEDGHTVLLPGPFCPCDDEADCPHGNDIDTDDVRTFRAHDAVRLRELCDRMAVKA